MAGEDTDSISLKVSKAIPSDVGHGRARISGENDLDLKPEISSRLRVIIVQPLQFTGEAAQKMQKWTLSELMESFERMLA